MIIKLIPISDIIRLSLYFPLSKPFYKFLVRHFFLINVF